MTLQASLHLDVRLLARRFSPSDVGYRGKG
jgi:hypothetical protein